MSALAKLAWIGPEEYLEGEMYAQAKHEYVAGRKSNCIGVPAIAGKWSYTAQAIRYASIRWNSCCPWRRFTPKPHCSYDRRK
jgi:hypothetical protein